MHTTPENHHEIRSISGEAEDIYDRGVQIESLGHQMIEAARVLTMIKDGAEIRGKSLESIKDSVGDAAADLDQAGKRYKPSGTAIRKYGDVLHDTQQAIDPVIVEAERLWAIYETARAAHFDAQDVPPPDGEPVEGEPDPAKTRQDGIDAAHRAVSAAYEAWKTEARKYDAPFEAWDVAYDTARTSLKDANDDGVKDGFWDDALPAIESLLTVLSYVGAVLAVLAIVIGGPFIAILALIVGVVTLALTIIKVAKGRGSGWEIAVAVIGILPFGKLAGIFKGVAKAAPGTRVAAFTRTGKDALGEMAGLTNVRQMRRLTDITSTRGARQVRHGDGSLNQNGTTRLRQRLAAMEGVTPRSTALERLLVGSEGALARNLARVVDDGSAVARNNVRDVLNQTADGRVIQDLIDAGRSGSRVDVMNLVDAAGKPAGTFTYDRFND